MPTAKGTVKKPGISAVMIGRDEAHHLPMSLAPLQRAMDEIIFVDTGSRDHTPEIAQQFGCRVYHQPWLEDFSTPKNHAIDQASHTWILNVDCDEVLMAAEQARERILQQTLSQAPAFIIQIDNLMADDLSVPSKALRLFRNDARIRFQNPVHEGIAEALFRHWPHTPPPFLDIHLQHYGYQAGANREKIKRNVAILRHWSQREPQNIYCSFKLGANLRHFGSNREGLFFLEKAFTLMDNAPDRDTFPFLEELVTVYFQALMENGLSQKAQTLRTTVLAWG